MPAPSDWLIPAAVIGIESFPVWFEKSIGDVSLDCNVATEALIPLVNAELKAVVAERVDFARLDAPSFARYPDMPDHFLDRVPIQVFEGEARRLPEGATPRVLRRGERLEVKR